MSDQYTLQDPTRQYPKAGPEFQQYQPGPGLEQKMPVKPDAGEQTYRGSGRLAGRKAIVTGADSGIGRAVAIAFAREGADVVLSYLPAEEPDAQEVVQLIEEAGRTAVALPGDVKNEAYCEHLVAS
ncbi:MAG TPA: SDR family NAD(P)-dependent oxidoreductase, partial [Ktedonobacteraceae bacterium]|nr:SDR family NAD(P)-dependent oxidoreductase [Ktedonobacteraceae bacterium]